MPEEAALSKDEEAAVERMRKDSFGRLANAIAEIANEMNHKRVALEEIQKICAGPGRSADKISKINAMATAGLLE